MENNKLLIGIQFTEEDGIRRDTGEKKYKHIQIELYVVRDITLSQLLDGIKYGLEKMARADADYEGIYRRCFNIFMKCCSDVSHSKDGKAYYSKITLTSFNADAVGGGYGAEKRFAFSLGDEEKRICDLGFITSSKIIFDASGTFPPLGMLDTSYVIEAFDPDKKQRIVFPEYNISTRQLYQFDRTPIELIAPTDPPQKPNNSLFSLLLPSIISLSATIVIRLLMSGFGSASGASMILLTVGMGISAAILTTREWKKQKMEYAENLKSWRTRYQDYINSVIAQIKDRQKKDVEQLDKLYPDMLTLINKDEKGVYGLNQHIYSRVPQDADFLTFRIGVSDDIPSFFEIKGEDKDVIFANSFFEIKADPSGKESLSIFLREELDEKAPEKENLCKLPHHISQKYAHLKKAPLLYSLKNKSCLGVVDRDVHEIVSKSYYFISRMIFELCYYHSPEELQFVVFFNKEKEWAEIEKGISRYKFMPHFRGLFSDKSQFVFDKESAHLVMSSLLSIMNTRKNQESGTKSPHIVMVIFDEYGLKEHAFAEYLPDAPEAGQDATNPLGLSFVFAAKYKEYLPAYCNDIVDFANTGMTLTPRNNIAERKYFYYDCWDRASNMKQFYIEYTQEMMHAMRFFSSVYYARIAQNGKVPSSVSMFEAMDIKEKSLCETICTNWGIDDKCERPSVTKSLRVPIGKTESGLAYLDLHEKADGPHMLVAGTTGSGKTETIISYLLGLCMQYRPDEINLLLVDMKGGGFTKRIGHLPHVVGAVTDVEGDENGTGAEYMLSRFLYAMKAEIKRRKLLLNKLHVDSIDKYIEACGDIDAHIAQKKLDEQEANIVRETAKESLSHLILVVDEFTELKRFSNENNDVDFIGEITTIARVGRSLGLHIILISQNIEGAITDDIRVNTNARLCLKVATKQASKEMIGTELAASAHMPGNGRAYLLVGTGSKFEYFQSAYSGAGVDESIPIEITLASKIGKYSCFYRSDKDNPVISERKKEQKKAGTIRSQLDVICEAIEAANKKSGLKEPHKVFSSPLPPRIAWDPEKDAVINLSKGRGTNK